MWRNGLKNTCPASISLPRRARLAKPSPAHGPDYAQVQACFGLENHRLRAGDADGCTRAGEAERWRVTRAGDSVASRLAPAPRGFSGLKGDLLNQYNTKSLCEAYHKLCMHTACHAAAVLLFRFFGAALGVAVGAAVVVGGSEKLMATQQRTA